MNKIAIVQARMNSSRLPGKALLDLDGKPALERVVSRLKKCKLVDDIIIATTPTSNEIIAWCSANKVRFFVGNESDVLGRVFAAAEPADIIIDITADCPLIDHEVVDLCIETMLDQKLDYVSNTIIRTYPDGFDVQVYSYKVLMELDRVVENKTHRKHTGWNVLEYMEIFDANKFVNGLHIGNITADEEYQYPDIRVTLDTEEDYLLLEAIFEHFQRHDFGYKQVIDLLKSRPSLLEINKNIKAKIPGEG